MRVPAILATTAGLALWAPAQAATPPAHEHASSPTGPFDLTSIRGTPGPARGNDRLPSPQLPEGSDLRLIAFDAPELDIPLSDRGPVMTMGALGSRYENMPSLVHVGMAWDF